MNDNPRLSVVILAAQPVAALGPLLRSLQAQSYPPLELVLVGENPPVPDHPLLAWCSSVQTVRHPLHPSSSEARAAGVRAARADAVVFVEDHCFPQPGWAQALVARIQEGWSAVGPAFENGNPDSLISWLNFLVEYGDFCSGQGGPSHHLPGHNSCYRRDVLLRLGDRLGSELESESTLQWRLKERYYLEPQARVRHWNFSLLGPSLALRFHGGWLFGANRTRSWASWRRLLYLAAAPLIPAVRLTRLLRRLPAPLRTPTGLAALTVFLLCDAAGEAMGYATARSEQPHRFCTESEYARQRYLSGPEAFAFAQVANPT